MRKLSKDRSSKLPTWPILPSQDLALKFYEEEKGSLPFGECMGDAEVTFGWRSNLTRLFRLYVSVGEQARACCDEIRDKFVAGHDVNAAVFFSERYYRRATTEELAFLAAGYAV